MLVVDAANVIGSRPTGWWRDRPGAARAFVGQLRAAAGRGVLPLPVVVVLEGEARAGAAETDADGVRVVHAAGSGDDALLAELARPGGDPGVTVVTADRALGDRARHAGAETVGPSWLYRRLGPSHPGGENAVGT
ncbi:MAG: hypothetical protein ACP5P9_04705 [Acidimicrobiales bacterium]